MKIEVLITRNSERWEEGIDYLLEKKGLWLRVYRKRSGKKGNSKKLYGDLMSFDLKVLTDVGEKLDLEKLKRDRTISKKGQQIKVHLFRIWGAKLEEVMSRVESSFVIEESEV